MSTLKKIISTFYKKATEHKAAALFSIILLVYLIIGISFFEEKWDSVFVQTGAFALTIFFTLIVNIENNKLIKSNTDKQLKAIQQNTDRQIEELQRVTNLEIEALKENTDKQIEHYRQETQKLVEELKNNSELLAGILLRQLEDSIEKTHYEASSAEKEYKKAHNWQLLRTVEERDQQISNYRKHLKYVKGKLDYLNRIYERVRNTFTNNSPRKEINP